ncbi:MAG TPA: zinc metallopeptidase [Anaerolineales bacterium]|nr:zinc metallopeptidase [Anaerolineales bacterium]
MPFLFSSDYLIYILPAMFIMLATQWYVKSTYSRWGQVPTRNHMSGAEAAQRLIQRNALYDVTIEGVQGNLTDHYDPRKKVLRLSPGVYQGTSVASLAVAAHELGHAMQDKEGYAPLRFRAALVPAVNIGSMLGWVFILIGMFLRLTPLAWLGVVVFALGAVFALATLPVELNASSRAREMLLASGIIVGDDEKRGVRSVLNAAALTYVAALITSLLQVFYYVSLVTGMGRRR